MVKLTGIPLRPEGLEPVMSGPGLGWKLSDDARAKIEAVERAIVRPAGLSALNQGGDKP